MKDIKKLIENNDITFDGDTIYLNDSVISKREFIAFMKLMIESDKDEKNCGKKLNKRRKKN